MLPWEERFGNILKSWAGTPWMPGQCMRGVGVDCRFLVIGVLDEFLGVTIPKPPRIPQDTGVNNPILATSDIAALRRRYPADLIAVPPFETTDVLVVRPPRASAHSLQHLMIVGPGDPHEVWHSIRGGVCRTSVIGWQVTKAFRLNDKHLWV